MNTVTLSKDYKIAFSKEIRQSVSMEAGTTFEVIPYKNRIELIPIKPIKNLKGIFKGIDTTILREDDRL